MKRTRLNKKRQPNNDKIMPGHPPEDYKGSVGDWLVKLQEHGHWDMKNPEWYGDVRLTVAEYTAMLKATEGKKYKPL